MFYYDHAMSRDDVYDEPEHSEKELDMVDGLRAMAMFKREPGPLGPKCINQDVKHALVAHPESIMELVEDGFISDPLIRELEQMMSDMHGSMDKDMSKTLPSSFIMIVGGNPMQYGSQSMDGVGNPGKSKSKKKKNIPTNPKLYARVKAAAKRKFKVYPSAYANAWLVREYKKRGGGYRKG